MEMTRFTLDGLILATGKTHVDERGSFVEMWREDVFAQTGILTQWRQDNLSRSLKKGTIRGLHWQVPPHAQAKLVRVIKGRILDVVVDIRTQSQTFGQFERVELGDQENQTLFVPEGFAHGFCTLEDDTIVHYKVSHPYAPTSEKAIHWNCPKLNIDWQVPGEQVATSPKDGLAPNFVDIAKEDFFP
jgi:dTDP-4-dehydrorhamnose 3,5-epimerase